MEFVAVRNRYGKFLRNTIAKYPFLSILLVVFVLVYNFVIVSIPSAHQRFINHVLEEGFKEQFFQVLGIIIVLYVLQVVISLLRDYLSSILSEKIRFQTRVKLTQEIAKLPHSYFVQHGVEYSLVRYNTDANNVASHYGSALPELISQICSFVLVVIVLIISKPYILLLSLIIIALYLLLGMWVGKKIKKSLEHYLQAREKSIGCFSEQYSNNLIIKLYNLYEWSLKRFKQTYVKEYKSRIHTDVLYSVNLNSAKLLANILSIIVWGVVGFQVLKGTATVGELIAMIEYQGLLVGPIYFISQFNNSYQETTTSISRLFEIFAAKKEELSSGDSLQEVHRIDVSNLSFSYGMIPVLKKANFYANKGEFVGVIGESGGGKSTFIHLLLGLYQPQEGQVCVNGKNITLLNVMDLRDHIGCTPQFGYFFQESIVENLFLEAPNWKKIETICKEIGLHEEIKQTSEQYQTILTGNGSNLSGGQRTRLDLLRLLLANKDVLILDEVTASLDMMRRNKLFSLIHAIKKDKIIIMVSHNKDEWKQFDRYYEITDGFMQEGEPLV